MKTYFLWLSKLLTLIVVFVFVLPIVFFSAIAVVGSTVGPATPEVSKYKNPHTVAVLELNGAIMKSREIIKNLKKQVDNDSVKGIVLRIDSPGGAVAPSQEIYEAVKTFKKEKPIVVSMGSVAASGGLYASLGASRVFAQEGTLTGSIGVIMQFPNFSAIADKLGFTMTTIKSGPYKDVGNGFRTMSDFEREYLQETVMDVRSQFVNAIVEGRGLPREKVEKIADGRIFIGTYAREIGLVDEIGGVLEAAHSVFELLDEPLGEGEKPYIVYPMEKYEVFKKLLGAVSERTLKLLSTPHTASSEVRLLFMM